jgi:hypothetical protein
LYIRAKKIWFIETEFLVKGKTGNLRGEKETRRAGREIIKGLFDAPYCSFYEGLTWERKVIN